MNYNKLLLDELRLVVYEKGDNVLTEDLLVKAITVNENLKSLGYVLNPTDIVALATSPSLDGFYNQIKAMTDKVNAAPMYPGFPRQVMEIEEAVFRFHQIVHYFSTYGMELLFGVEAKYGWLPYENKAEGKTAEQKIVLKAKTIKLLPSEDAYIVPYRIILSRKERMTLPEKKIITEAVSHISIEDIRSVKVNFKENMNALYSIVFDMPNKESSFMMLKALCECSCTVRKQATENKR